MCGRNNCGNCRGIAFWRETPGRPAASSGGPAIVCRQEKWSSSAVRGTRIPGFRPTPTIPRGAARSGSSPATIASLSATSPSWRLRTSRHPSRIRRFPSAVPHWSRTASSAHNCVRPGTWSRSSDSTCPPTPTGTCWRTICRIAVRRLAPRETMPGRRPCTVYRPSMRGKGRCTTSTTAGPTIWDWIAAPSRSRTPIADVPCGATA